MTRVGNYYRHLSRHSRGLEPLVLEAIESNLTLLAPPTA